MMEYDGYEGVKTQYMIVTATLKLNKVQNLKK